MLSIPARHCRTLVYPSKLANKAPTLSNVTFVSLTSPVIQRQHFSSKNLEEPLPHHIHRPERTFTMVLKDFNQITKFKLGILNTWVTITTFMMKGGSICSSDCMLVALATQLMAMSSQTVNQILESDYDKLMNRTKNRPLPQGKITKTQAWTLGGLLYASSNYLLIQYMPIQATVVANSIFFGYILGYTPLKRVSELNTPIGAIIGSLTSYLGWAAAGGSLLSLDPFLVFFYTFCWQFPHFYGILWTYKDDYKKAGFVMLQDAERACKQIKLALVGQSLSVGGLLFNGAIDPISATVTWYMLYKHCFKPMKNFGRDPNFQTARKMTILSYGPFTILFAFIYINLGLKTWGYDKKIKKALGFSTSETKATEKAPISSESN